MKKPNAWVEQYNNLSKFDRREVAGLLCSIRKSPYLKTYRGTDSNHYHFAGKCPFVLEVMRAPNPDFLPIPILKFN